MCRINVEDLTMYGVIRVRTETKNVADKLAKKFSISLVDLFESSMDYFVITGIDPRDQIILAPADELKKLRNTLVSFIRQQEKEFIKPVFSRVDMVMGRFLDYVENEAPKVSGQRPVQNLQIDAERKTQTPQAEQKIIDDAVKETSEDYAELLEKYDLLKKYFVQVMEKVTFETVNLAGGKKAVINLPAHAVKSIQDFSKTL